MTLIWRDTWRGRFFAILGIHSPTAHMVGKCWCQRKATR